MTPLRGLAVAALTAVAAPAVAQTVSERPDSVAITIYRDQPVDTRQLSQYGGYGGLVFVTETRTIDVPAGQGRVEFRGVADRIVAQTASIQGLEAAVVERNEDFDLLSPGSLAENTVGRRARLVSTNPATGAEISRAVLVRSGPQGVILQTPDGMEALSCSGLPERLVFEEVPSSLAARPTLSAVTRATRAGRRKVTLSYLATGLTWSADYVARVNRDGRTLDLTGWLTLANFSRTTFDNVPAQVVAGELSRDPSTRHREVYAQPLYPNCWPVNPGFTGEQFEAIVVTGSRASSYAELAMAPPPVMAPAPAAPPPPMAQQSELGDYKLYTLPDATTVAANQTKQVRFLEQRRVPFDKVYRYDAQSGGGPAVVLRLRNTREQGLGLPLPQGAVTVMEPDRQGGLLLAGQHRLQRDAPVGLPVEVIVGVSSDLVTTTRVVDQTEGSTTLEVTAANHRPTPAVLEVREFADGRTISRGSRPHEVKDAHYVWRLELAPGQVETLRYTVTTK